MIPLLKSEKLNHVCYDIRGPIVQKSKQLEKEGHQIINLNIGNLSSFGFDAPAEIQHDIIKNLPNSAGYSDSKGIFPARKAVMHLTQQQNIKGVDLEDIFLGNGASELIHIAVTGLLNNGDEVLLPAPDYPLWTASVNLAGGNPVHYQCIESLGWQPDINDIRQKITKKTKALVIINPNNPTGAVYQAELLLQIIALAREYHLVIFSDEVYDKIIYDEAVHIPLATLSEDVVTITFNSLSKSYRSCGYRAGWMYISGDKMRAKDYIDGLNTLATMRLCPNVPAQWGIQTALGGYQSIQELVRPGGRLYKQRAIAYDMLNTIPGVSCFKPQGALYMFVRLNPDIYPIEDDKVFIQDLLEFTKVLVVQGSGFNYPDNHYFRIVFLPYEDQLKEAIHRIAKFLKFYQNNIHNA